MNSNEEDNDVRPPVNRNRSPSPDYRNNPSPPLAQNHGPNPLVQSSDQHPRPQIQRPSSSGQTSGRHLSRQQNSIGWPNNTFNIRNPHGRTPFVTRNDRIFDSNNIRIIYSEPRPLPQSPPQSPTRNR